MRYCVIVLFSSLLLLNFGCSRSEPSSPHQTFETYVRAMKAKDYSSMKVLLSDSTIKMHETEAKTMGTNVDDIIKRQSLIAPDQKTVEYRNEKIDGDKATLQYKNSYGQWDTMPFVREDGVWKIDKKGYAVQIEDEFKDSDRKLDELINGNRSVTP